jgi:hypothetical protein
MDSPQNGVFASGTSCAAVGRGTSILAGLASDLVNLTPAGMPVLPVKPSGAHRQMVADGVRNHQKEQKSDRGMSQSQEV